MCFKQNETCFCIPNVKIQEAILKIFSVDLPIFVSYDETN